MSASDKKKLRKEQNAAAMTEKQLAEQKQQKKAKAYTITFITAMVLVIVLVVVAVTQPVLSNYLAKTTTAVTINDHELSAVQLNYYYVDCMNNFYNQFSSYGEYQDIYIQMYTGFNPAASVGSQAYSKEVGTWADYFIDSAISNATWTYAMYDKAMSENYQIPEDSQTYLDSLDTYLAFYASYYKFSDVKSYLVALYGNGATVDGYKEYCEMSTIASAYANEYYDSLEYTNDQIRDYESDKMLNYNSYSYATFYLNADDYLTGGKTVTGEDGKETTEYSDEEYAAARDAAKAAAQQLVDAKPTNAEELNEAIGLLYKGEDSSSSTTKTCTEITDKLYTSLSTTVKDVYDWVTNEERQSGDLTIVEYKTKTDDVETVKGYYVVLFEDCKDNTTSYVGTVRHLLVQFTKDKDGKSTEETKAADKAKAEDLLQQYLNGEEQTEEAFAALIKEHSDDTEDGLYSDITPDSSYVTEFKDWATAAHEVGDVEIIETTYGYHIMYYVSCNELNYRDYLISADIASEDYTEWEDDIMDNATTVEGNLKYINTDYVMHAGY